MELPAMKEDIGLPKVHIEKGKKSYSLHWDYQSNEANNILFKKKEYLDGYIDGVVAALANPEAIISCSSGVTGTIHNLSNEAALRLEEIISGLLHPLVKKEHEKIVKYNNLPHVTLQREQSGT
jgi:hypothetical protein